MLLYSIFKKLRRILRPRRVSTSWMFHDYPMFKLEDHDPWFVDAYYSVRRFLLHNRWISPFRIYRELRWFIQRGRRGWADCDTWSLDNYIDGWMPDALRYLKEHKHGTPGSMFTAEDCIAEGDWQGNPSEEGHVRAAARWDAIMDKMIAAFEAHRKQDHGIYEEELGTSPLSRPAGVSAEAWATNKDDRFERSKLLDKHYEEVWQEGAALFIKHYSSLWD